MKKQYDVMVNGKRIAEIKLWSQKMSLGGEEWFGWYKLESDLDGTFLNPCRNEGIALGEAQVVLRLRITGAHPEIELKSLEYVEVEPAA